MTTIPDQPPVNHEAALITLMTTIRDLVQSAVPGYALAAKGRRRKITATASLSDPFLEAVASACGVHLELAAAGGMSAGEYRDAVARSRLSASLAEELRILARGVDDTNAENRNEVGRRALRVYAVAGRINSPEDREMLIPHLEAMRRTLNRGRTNARKLAAAKATAAARSTAAPATPGDVSPAVPLAVAPAVTPDGGKEVKASFKAGKDL
jgi:hypothetical protein